MRNKFISTEQVWRQSQYKGIPIGAVDGLHDEIGSLLTSLLPKNSRVLDLGAGYGALSLRLSDLGFEVSAIDKEDHFQPKGIPFQKIDLDNDAPQLGPFDAVCAVEVIEHVKNPEKLMDDCWALIKSGGYLILSTPNITSFLSRMIFLRTGRFHQFLDKDRTYGHIMPMASEHLFYFLREIGYEITQVRACGYLPLLSLEGGFVDLLNPKTFLFSAAMLFLYPFMRGYKQGWCLIIVARKPI